MVFVCGARIVVARGEGWCTREEVEEALLAAAEAAQEQMRNRGRCQLKVFIEMLEVREQALVLCVRVQ